MKNCGISFCKNLYRYLLILIMCSIGSSSLAQVSKIFSLPQHERLFNLCAIAETDYFHSADSVYVFNSLDTVIELSKKSEDERTGWYAQYFKQLYNGRKWHDVKKEIVEMRQMEGWINHCPLEVIKASYQHLLGNLLFTDLQFAEAFNMMLKAQKTFETIGFENIPEVGQYIYQLGNNYYIFEDYAKALKYLNLSRAYPSYIKNVNISKLNSVGMVYQKQKNYIPSKQVFTEAIELAKKYNDSTWIGIASGNYGYTVSLQGNHKEAIAYLLLDYDLNHINEPKNTAITALYLANSYIQTGDYKSAAHYLQKGLELEGNINDPVFYKHYYGVTSKYFAAGGNYNMAYKYADSAIAFKDSLKAIFNSNILASAERRIETEAFLANTRLNQEQQRSQMFKRNAIMISIAGLLMLGLLLLFQKIKFLQRDKKIQAQKEALLSAQKLVVEEKLNTAEVQLNSYIKNISEKNDLLEKINTELKTMQATGNTGVDSSKLEKLNELMHFTILTEEDWKKFKLLFDTVHPNFFIRIKEQFPDFTPAETRLLALLKLKLSHREMSAMLGISADTVTKTKYRLKKKIAEMPVARELEALVNEL
jgi:tetratricopeptide (TPR) repeat protein